RIDPRRNVWLQNTGAMASRIEEIPYVLTAHVHRQPPGDVTIAIVERRPFALVRSGDEMALIDASLRVLDVGGDANGAMPLLVLEPGIDLAPGRTLRQSSARALLAVTLSLRAHGVAADEVDDEGGDVRVRLPGGARVLLGDETSATKAVPLVEPILTRFALLGREVRVLDLRSPTTPVVTEGGQSAPAPAPKPTAPESPPAPRRSP
ncbi:MAG TPA: FtsQ-type POTRA domain-containing protein, partial [Candidatus Tyrphobacter sp.]